MKIDYKLKIPYDLRKRFLDYDPDGLKHYFQFYSADDKSINSTIENIANSVGLPATGHGVKLVNAAPYPEKVRYSSELSRALNSYYRIPWGGEDGKAWYNPWRANSLSMWIAINRTGYYSADSVDVLFNKVQAGSTAGEWSFKGEMRLEYNVPGGFLQFIWAGYNTSTSSTYLLTYRLPDLDSLPRGPYRNLDWLNFGVIFTTQFPRDPTAGSVALTSLLKFFINGKEVTPISATGGDTGGGTEISAYWVPRRADGDILFGRGKADAATAIYESPLQLFDFAVWDRKLKSSAFNSIWQTSQRWEGSGYVSLPPRVRLREEINTTPAYLSSLNTPVVKSSDTPFDDQKQVGLDRSELHYLQYPFGIPTRHKGTEWYLEPLREEFVSASLATPNRAPDIVAKGYRDPSLLGSYYTNSQINQGIPETTPFNDALVLQSMSGSFYSKTTSISGFESSVRNQIQITMELPVNETAHVTRHSALWDVKQTNKNTDGTSNKINPHWDGNAVAAKRGEYYQKDLSGFLYYNPKRGVWEQKGLNDVCTGISKTFQDTAQETNSDVLETLEDSTRRIQGYPMINSGSSTSLRLFYPGHGVSSGMGQYYGYGSGSTRSESLVGILPDADKRMAANIGHPMLSCYGPNANQYFATSSQRIKMSDYISEPFLLEKVILEIPDTVARRVYDYQGGKSYTAPSARVQDDFVFFLMRQQKNSPGTSNPNSGNLEALQEEVSSSMRYLICSGNACFYNSKRNFPSVNGSSFSTNGDWSPRNTPAFSYDYNKTMTGTSFKAVRSGSIFLPMAPAVANEKNLGNFIIPTWNGTLDHYITQSILDVYGYTSGGCFPATITSYWPGGTTTLPLNAAGKHIWGSRFDTDKANLWLTRATGSALTYWGKENDGLSYNQRTFAQINPYDKKKIWPRNPKTIDPRVYKQFGDGASKTTVNFPGSTTTALSGSWLSSFPDDLSSLNAPCPYLLFPEDELVLGLDAALGWTATMAAGTTVDGRKLDGTSDSALVHVGANNLTGSLLKLEGGPGSRPMVLRFFGSLVKDQKEAPKYPASNIAQPNITQTIIGGHVVDQYDISIVKANSGSYRERLLTGSMTNGKGPERVGNPGYNQEVRASKHPLFDVVGFYIQTRANEHHTVVTCSFGNAYNMWGGSTGTANPFYIRFINKNGFIIGDPRGSWKDWMEARKATTGVSGLPLIKDDEIYVRSNYRNLIGSPNSDQYGSTSRTVSSLKSMIEGTTNTNFVFYGAGCGGNSSGENQVGIPGITYTQDGPSNELSIIATRGTYEGNTIRFIEGRTEYSHSGSGYNMSAWSPLATDDTWANPPYPQWSTVHGLIGKKNGPNTGSLDGGVLSQNPFREIAASATRGNLGDYGSFNRFVTLICPDEQYYDSAVPPMLDIWSCLGKSPKVIAIEDLGTGAIAVSGSLSTLVYGINTGKTVFPKNDGTTGLGGLPDYFSNKWWAAYPFESRFNYRKDASTGIKIKTERMFGGAAAKDADGNVAATLYWITDDSFKGWGNGWPGHPSGSLGFCWQDIPSVTSAGNIGPSSTMGLPGYGASATSTYASPTVGWTITMENQVYGLKPQVRDLAHSTLKIFYGIGDGVGNLIESSPESGLYPTSPSYSGDGISPDALGYYPSYYQILRRSKKPRGWKYGLLNALPQNTQAVFRSDRYGQFRDMLESRPYAVLDMTTPAVGESEPVREINFHTPPVQVHFVQPTWYTGQPEILMFQQPGQTRSGNLSQYATSSLPYFDETILYPYGRDRPSTITFSAPGTWSSTTSDTDLDTAGLAEV